MAEQRDEFLKKLKVTNNKIETKEDDALEKFFEGLKDLPDRGNVFLAARMETDRRKELEDK